MKNICTLKRHKTAFETELFVVDEEGKISNRADEIIKKTKTLQLDFPIQEEYCHHLIEITSEPKREMLHTANGWVQTLQTVIEESKKLGLMLYAQGTYPAKFIPKTRNRYYKMKEEIIGREKMLNGDGKVAGFHFHYCLPHRTFDKKEEELKQLFHSENKEILLSIHNALIAADPAFMNFMASSPFYEGEHLAMDTKNLFYRDKEIKVKGKVIKGMYSEKKMFGKLPEYALSISELILRIEKRYEAFRNEVKEKCPQYMDVINSMHPMKMYWGPLRISRYGTFEYRGLDMNLPSYIIGSGLLIKYMIKRIRNEGLKVMPTDIGIKEPFKVEGETLHVPPFTYVDEVLQYKAILEGTDSHEVRNYMKSIIKFAMPGIPKRKDAGLMRIKEILETGKTRSDVILKRAVKLGWGRDSKLGEDIARKIVLTSADELEKEVEEIAGQELIIDAED
ncbi:MAG: glutamate-cysteine ligase family protein [Candidatus Micrarchaeota archaeon]